MTLTRDSAVFTFKYGLTDVNNTLTNSLAYPSNGISLHGHVPTKILGVAVPFFPDVESKVTHAMPIISEVYVELAS